MALTLEIEQRLKNAKLDQYFDKNRDEWLAIARDTYRFVAEHFPPGSVIRRDDVAKPLEPIVEVHSGFQSALATGRLTQKYWNKHYSDLVIDRTWHEIQN